MKALITTFISGICLIFFLFVSPFSAYAHGSGPPYVKINDQYAQTNAITTYVTPTKFSVGADVASFSGYLVGAPMRFEIDEEFFPNPYKYAPGPQGIPVLNPNAASGVEFRWNFADGSPVADGKSVTHTYGKPGTYFVDIQARYPEKDQSYTSVNTVKVDIIPQEDYELPRVAVTVNGKNIDNPARDIIEIQPGSTVELSSAVSSGSIVSYQWDLGDDSSSLEKSVKHRYRSDTYFPVFPVLRVTDNNNLVYDTFAFIDTPITKPNVFVALWNSVIDFFTGLFGSKQ